VSIDRNKLYVDDAETAVADVRDAVAALRWLGHKTVSGMHKVAAHCGVTPSRIRTLFYRDQTFLVFPDERRSIALSIAALFDSIARDCEDHAEVCRVRGDAIRLREQLSLPLLGDDIWNGKSPRRRSAA
jgi:hypothetical protein